MIDERRIRHLHIRSPKTALLQPARHQLEEAIRLCSLPGLPPHAQLLIRHLQLGAIRVDQPPSRLTQRVNQLVRDQLARAVCVDQRSAPTADAVWFSDPLTPLRVLLQRLLDGQAANEWYWAALLRSSHPGRVSLHSPSLHGTNPGIALLLTKAAHLPLRGLAVARLLQACLAPARWQRLCGCITPALARQLLSMQGVVIDEVGRPGQEQTPQWQTITAPALDQAWQQALQVALDYWGAGDIRSQWVAWNALVSMQPAWLEQSVPVARIVPEAWGQSWGMTPVSSATQAALAGPRSMAAVIKASVIAKTFGKEKNRDAASPSASPVPSNQQRQETTCTECVPQQCGQIVSGVSAVSGLVKPVEQKAEILGVSTTSDLGMSITTPADPAAVHAADNNAVADLSLVSPQAGFVLLIALLQRLDLPALLAANEALLDLHLPQRLLRSLAKRLQLAANDPLHQLWQAVEPNADSPLEKIKMPLSWQRLTTASGRPLHRLDANNPTLTLPQLLNLLHSLAALWLRRHCRLSLRSLINRPGKVILTATHWDVLFDLNQVDLRLRRVALDVDPGWVPWLGRVVQLHYRAAGDGHVENH